VLLRRTDRFPDTSVLLDGTPSRVAGWDADLQAALTVGVPVTVAGGQFTVRVDSITADGAVVSVVPSPPAAAPAAPAPAEEPAPGGVLPGDAAGNGVPPDGATDGDPTADSATPQDPATAVAPPEPATIDGPAGTAQTTLAAASQPTDGVGGGLVLAGLGTALAGASMLVVRRLRRPSRR
jgi:hypothetical protein